MIALVEAPDCLPSVPRLACVSKFCRDRLYAVAHAGLAKQRDITEVSSNVLPRFLVAQLAVNDMKARGDLRSSRMLRLSRLFNATRQRERPELAGVQGATWGEVEALSAVQM